jgi:hypothetical protein
MNMFDDARNELYLSPQVEKQLESEQQFKEDVKGAIDWLMEEGIKPTFQNIMSYLDCNLTHVGESYIESVIEEVVA